MKDYTPNGLSVSQLKKDAKKLKKALNIKLSEAQKIIVKEKTNFNTWESMINAIDNVNGSIGKLSYLDINKQKKNIVIYKEKPLLLINMPPSYGKSLLCCNFIINSSYNNILYCNLLDLRTYFKDDNNFNGFDGVKNVDEYIFKFKDEKILYNDLINGSLIDTISDKHELVIIDEGQRLNLSDDSFYKLVEKCKKLSIPLILTTQYLTVDELNIVFPFCSNVLNVDSRSNNLNTKIKDCISDKNAGVYHDGVRGIQYYSLIDNYKEFTTLLFNYQNK